MTRLKKRPEDQPLPTPVASLPANSELVAPRIYADLVELSNAYPHDIPVDLCAQLISDFTKRTNLGVQRYGQALRTFNGRDVLLDVYEESLDKSQYLRQAIMQNIGGQALRAMYTSELLCLAVLRRMLNAQSEAPDGK